MWDVADVIIIDILLLEARFDEPAVQILVIPTIGLYPLIVTADAEKVFSFDVNCSIEMDFVFIPGVLVVACEKLGRVKISGSNSESVAFGVYDVITNVAGVEMVAMIVKIMNVDKIGANSVIAIGSDDFVKGGGVNGKIVSSGKNPLIFSIDADETDSRVTICDMFDDVTKWGVT